MTSISSMIAFVVLLLATYSYSAPILTEIESTTMDIQLENSTMEIPVENATTMVHDKRSGNTIEKGDSASSEEATTVYTSTIDDLTTIEGQTDKPVKRENEEEDKRQTEEENKRENEEENKRETDEAKRETEEENKRETDEAKRENEEENKRETDEAKRENEEEDKRETDEAKRQNEGNQEVTPENEDNQQVNHENEGNQEGTHENEDNQQIKRENEDEKYTFDVTTGESSPLDVTTVESTSEATMERRMKDFSMNSFESNSDFNKRAMGPIQSVESDELTTVVNGEMEHKSNTIQPSSSTDEFAKTTGLVGEKQTSTSEYETTVEPVEESTNTSMVETKNSTKIIAIIPGRIAETKIVINPIKEVPVVAQKPLSQGQN